MAIELTTTAMVDDVLIRNTDNGNGYVTASDPVYALYTTVYTKIVGKYIFYALGALSEKCSLFFELFNF